MLKHPRSLRRPIMRGATRNEVRPWQGDPQIFATAQAAFDKLGLAAATSVDGAVRIVARATHKAVVLRLTDDPDIVMTTGFWMDFEDANDIMVRSVDALFSQNRSLLHEVSHIILDHPPGCVGVNVIAQQTGSSQSPEPRLFEQTREESEAEALAMLIVRHLFRLSSGTDEMVYG